MKAVHVILLVVVFGNALASPFFLQQRTPMQPLSFGRPVREPNIDFCKICIEFADEFLNQLLNIVLNVGVIGGCQELCTLLEEAVHVNSSLVGVVCNLLCDYVGIKEFISIIDKADLDPIYYCELLKTCAINDHGDAEITSLKVVPVQVEKGSTFKIEVQFMTKNGTGTGEIDLFIRTQDGFPVGENDLSEPLAPGTYNAAWSVQAVPQGCEQGPCEEWLPGNYTAIVSICNGECGSKHPHSQVYDTASAPFNVVKKEN